MMKIRVVKTGSKANAVQIVRYKNNKRIIVHHLGSSHTEEGLKELKVLAQDWITNYSSQLSIFPDESPNKLLHINHCAFIGIKYNFFYRHINKLQDVIGLGILPTLLKDLITIRIFEPASKLRSIDLIEQYFGISHNRKTYYKMAPNWSSTKDFVEGQVINFAKEFYSFN